MQKLRNLETSQLIDLLAQHTADYSKMSFHGTTEEEYAKCNLAIRAIQAEIELRKKREANKSNPETDITPAPDFS